MAGRFRDRFGPGIVSGGKLDLLDGGRAGRARGRSHRGRAPRPLHCLPAGPLLLRAPNGQAPRHAGRHWRLSAEQVRERLARVRDEVGPEVTIVAATKYLSVDGHGRPGRGRNRGRRREPGAGPRGQARRPRRRVPLAFHRPPPEPEGEARERDLRARALARLRVGSAPARGAGARSRSTSRARRASRASRRRRSPAFLELYPRDRRPLDDAPGDRRSRGVPSVLPKTAGIGRGIRADRAFRWERARITKWP